MDKRDDPHDAYFFEQPQRPCGGCGRNREDCRCDRMFDDGVTAIVFVILAAGATLAAFVWAF